MDNNLIQPTSVKPDATFEVFKVMKIKVAAFWVVTLCSGVVGYLDLKSYHPFPHHCTLKSHRTLIRSSKIDFICPLTVLDTEG